MNVLLWILQGLLAAAFLAHGWLLLAPPAEIRTMLEASFPRGFWIFLGIAEVLAAVGLTLPGITRILPRLVPLAAGGIIIVMISATIYHVMRGEMSSAAVTFLLLAMASFVAYMRWRIKPIQARQTT